MTMFVSFRRVLLFVLLFSFRLTAQTGGIGGTVKDSSGGAVANVAVALINQDTNGRQSQTTAGAGSFDFPQVQPGRYRREAEASGFKKFIQAGIVIDVQQQVAIDPVLQIGQTSESIEVTAETPLLQPNTSSLGQVVNNREIMDLPLIGRNTLSLIGLTAGTQPVGPFGGIPARTNAYNQGYFSTSGSQVVSNETLIDGIPANAAVFNAPAYVPVVDAVQEFKVQTNSFSAEFGRTGGGVVNMVTKSGTNTIHGSAYEFFRNNHLDANNWFNNRAGQKLPYDNFNQYGGTIGAPIVIPHLYDGHDKTFFFFNYEGLREHRGLTQLFTIPTTAQLAGDFRGGPTIYDPLTARPDPARAGQFIRDAFPNNIIPSNRLDSVAAKVRALYPAPNALGTASGASNFIGNGSAPNTQDQYTGRLDHAITQSQRLFARVSWSDVGRGAVDFFGSGAGWVNPGGGGVPLVFNARNAALGYTNIIAPTLLLDIRYGFVRQFVFKTPALTGIDLTTIGFPGVLNQEVFLRALPAFAPSGYQPLAAATSDLIHRADNTHSFAANLNKILQSHSVKFGFDYRFIPIGELQPSAPQGSFSFDSGFTGANPLAASASSGSSVASFLLGLPSSGSIDYNPEVSISSRYYGLYVQDDWRATKQLTVNFGLRYELETSRNERYDRLSWFDTSVTNPIGAQVGLPDLRGGLEFANVGGNPRRQKTLDPKNFGPRFGIAYSVTPKTVMRAGYGLFYLPRTGDDTGRSLGSEGFFAATTYVSSLDGGITPAGQLNNPFPNGLVQPPGSAQGLKTLLGQNLITVFHGDRAAYSQDWNFDIQRELPGGILIDAAYSGSKGTRLPVDIQLNQLPDKSLSLGPQLLQPAVNPFYGLITVGSLAGKTIPAGQLLRPYPEFGSINVRAVHEGNSTYHSAQLKAERRFSKGFSLLVAYTFSKMLTNAGSRTTTNFANPSIQDSNNLSAEKAPGNVDVPQRFVVSYNWELPFGPGRAFLSTPGLIGKIVGGWQLNGITILQGGVPLGLTTSNNQTNSLGGGSRPNNNGMSAKLSSSVEKRLTRYFDTSVFSQPPAFTFGNVARTLSDVRAPGLVNFDFSVIKNTRFLERANLQFRAEFFNLLNHPNFGSPGTTFGTSSFGVISSANDGRTIQFGLKLLF
jgi:hypothetical protein